MNRSGFLKSIATLIAAPSIISKTGFTPILPSTEEDKRLEVKNLEGSTIIIYTDEPCRLGDIIYSDMGSTAVITTIDCTSKRRILARPLKYGCYYFKDPTVFYRKAHLFNEQSKEA